MEIDLEAELAHMVQRTSVSDAELIARNMDVPELGIGKTLLEMTDFVWRHSIDGRRCVPK